jgi:hypothetical protein
MRNRTFLETIKEVKRNREILLKIYEVFGSASLPKVILGDTQLNFGCITGYNTNGQTHIGEFEIRVLHNNTFSIHKS